MTKYTLFFEFLFFGELTLSFLFFSRCRQCFVRGQRWFTSCWCSSLCSFWASLSWAFCGYSFTFGQKVARLPSSTSLNTSCTCLVWRLLPLLPLLSTSWVKVNNNNKQEK
jgi:hypothetical protein